jgi:enoyl-CoA hydratase/carnithine racemase
MSEAEVLSSALTDDGICVLTLNRPDSRNALNGALVSALEQTFVALRHDPAVRVVVLTAVGDVFCAGADLKERAGMSEREVADRIDHYGRAFGAIESLPKPVICAISGHAFGGGLELALACDLRLMREDVQVGLTELKLGIIPGAGGTQRLPRVVGVSKAKELIFTAARISAAEAVRIGLVTSAHSADTLVDSAIALGRQMLGCAPIALAQAKAAIDAGSEVDLATGLKIESRCYAITIPTEDRVEGLTAFREKRAPQFKGR